MDFSSYERLIITKYVGAQIEYPKMAISILSYWYLVLAFWPYFFAAGGPGWVPNCRSRRDLSIDFFIFYFRALDVMFKAKIRFGIFGIFVASPP